MNVQEHHKAQPLSARARTVLGFIEAYAADHGCPPTVREIGAGCALRSTRSVSDYLKTLEKAGYIRRRQTRSRGIELVKNRSASERGVPLLGRIAAGAPLTAITAHAEKLPVNAPALFGADDCFALEVTGDSMIDRHIVEGDRVIVRPGPTAHPGEVVAVDIDGEVTLKVYKEDGPRIVLMPANPAYNPIVLTGNEGEVRILGVMVGLVRNT